MSSTRPLGRDFDMSAGKTLAPTSVFIAYGIVKFFTLGAALGHWPDTYLPVLGGLASWVAVLLWSPVIFTREPSLRRSVFALSGFIPMLYAAYAIVYLGLYTIYTAVIVSFSVLGILFGIVCVALGYRMTYGLKEVTDMPGKRAS
jgi:hypothetical protein